MPTSKEYVILQEDVITREQDRLKRNQEWYQEQITAILQSRDEERKEDSLKKNQEWYQEQIDDLTIQRAMLGEKKKRLLSQYTNFKKLMQTSDTDLRIGNRNLDSDLSYLTLPKRIKKVLETRRLGEVSLHELLLQWYPQEESALRKQVIANNQGQLTGLARLSQKFLKHELDIQKILEYKLSEKFFEREPYLRKLLKGESQDHSNTQQSHILTPEMPTYALAVQELKKKNKDPLTLNQIIKARLEEEELCDIWGYSSTGLARKAHSTRFKLIPDCRELKEIDPRFKGVSLSVKYEAIDGIELDSNDALYNQLLTKSEIRKHPAWGIVGREYLDDYINLVFDKLNNPEKAMGFFLGLNTETDELRFLLLSNNLYSSNVGGGSSLSNPVSFIQVFK